MASSPASAQPNIVVTGGTGLVGRALVPLLLQAGYSATILTRQQTKAAAAQGLSYALWNPAAGQIDNDALQRAHAIVHLAGAGVMDHAWTPSYKQEIVNSRVVSTQLLAHALRTVPNTVQTIVSASAIGWYGADAGGPPFVETDPPASGFLGETCRQWEQAMAPAVLLGKRLVTLRTGIVLANEGGALAEFKKPLRFRVAGILGSGGQMVSWIHIADLCRIMVYALQTPQVAGVYNAVAPEPVRNKAMNLALGHAMYGNGFVAMPVPTAALRLALGERSVEILKSANVSAKKIMAAGFQFQFPNINCAVANLVKT
jgi:uncharacterized protein